MRRASSLGKTGARMQWHSVCACAGVVNEREQGSVHRDSMHLRTLSMVLSSVFRERRLWLERLTAGQLDGLSLCGQLQSLLVFPVGRGV